MMSPLLERAVLCRSASDDDSSTADAWILKELVDEAAANEESVLDVSVGRCVDCSSITDKDVRGSNCEEITDNDDKEGTMVIITTEGVICPEPCRLDEEGSGTVELGASDEDGCV